MATLYPPYIIERSSRGERTYDIFSRLLMDRIVFLGAPIHDDVANLMIHQPSGGAQGTAADIEIQAREILYLRSKMNALYSHHTGQPIETIERDMDRDRFMSAEEAKAYGLIDSVFTPRKELVPHTDGKK